MTAAQMKALNAQIWRDMGIIADSEPLMRRLAKYLNRLAKEKQGDPALMSKEEYLDMIDQAKREIADGKGHSFVGVEELDQYIRSL